MMRSMKGIASGLVIGLMLSGAAIAAPSAGGAKAPAPAVTRSSQPTQPDCQKVGGEVSVLIDQRKDSPNIAQARSVFQVGIMECMEGADDVANRHYQEAKNLLGGQQNPAQSIRIP